MSVPAFGQEMRDVEFPHLLPAVAFLNHGSYGAVSKQCKDQQDAMLLEYDSDPDMFRRYMIETYWSDARQALAPFFGTTADRLAIVTNTTNGINAVLKSLTYTTGDAILQNNLTYEAIQMTIAEVVNMNPGLQVVTIDHTFPITSTAEIVQQYTDALDANPNITVAVIDHIASMPAVVFPIEQLIPLCKSRGVTVVIDGAHCLGQVPLDLDTLGADFYIGNMHKWMYAARGCAVVYSAPAFDNIIKPVIVSYGFTDPFPESFRVQGTRDDVPLFQAKSALEFYNYCGGMSTISAYITDLGNRMADMLATAWGTARLGIPAEMEAPFIKMVQLPPMPNYPLDSTGTAQLMEDVRNLYNIWAPFTVVNGFFYLRLSSQIYCIEGDYQRLRDAILALQVAASRDRRSPKNYDTRDLVTGTASPPRGRTSVPKNKKSGTCVVM